MNCFVFNVLLLLLPNGPHGSPSTSYDFGPWLLTQDHSLLHLLVVRISTYFTCHTELAPFFFFFFFYTPYQWDLPSFFFTVDGDTWISLSTLALGAARTLYSFSAWLALSALVTIYNNQWEISARIFESCQSLYRSHFWWKRTVFGVAEKSLEELVHVCVFISVRRDFCCALATYIFIIIILFFFTFGDTA